MDKEEVDKELQKAEEDEKLIEKTKEEVKKESEEEGLLQNPGQRFDEYGMLESTVRRGDLILTKLKNTFKEEQILPMVSRRVTSESQVVKEDVFHPIVSFTGEEIIIRFVVPPTDKFGNDGRVWITKEEEEKWVEEKNDN